MNRLAVGVGASTNPIIWAAGNRIYFINGDTVQYVPSGGGGPNALGFTARMDIDLAEDRRVAFNEAWKELNDRFYDPKFHGRDWKSIGEKYRPLVEWCCTKEEFRALLDEMFGELNASHLGVYREPRTSAQDTAYLGVLYDDSYDGPGVKISKVMPKGPADHDESRLKKDEYILEVDGKPATLTESFYSALNAKIGKRIRLLVNDKPSATGARSVYVRGIGAASWRNLVYEDWVRGKREMTDKLSGGKAAYIHVIDMMDPARFRFERELFSLTEGKDALVLDVRFNTGGNTHDALLRILERTRPYFRMRFRGGREFNQPERAWTKPTVLLVNERSVSDAEIFPNGFRELGLGKIVGEKTNGYVIFTNQYTLIDGTVIRRPFNACLRLDGTDLENYGVPPDIRVENTPDDNAAGRDPQLERAVKEALGGVKGRHN